ncbi:hypothetical protein HPP92_009099 [Vanilla planifolia]|uniref:Uncharacterized protein n=1 Tax=Vanilla planifolia TaxID=51239 RepID=A0A835V601_VANPL|nr:hypothetical protein HPP92_009099 [Vanilla planifolia]
MIKPICAAAVLRQCQRTVELRSRGSSKAESECGGRIRQMVIMENGNTVVLRQGNGKDLVCMKALKLLLHEDMLPSSYPNT